MDATKFRDGHHHHQTHYVSISLTFPNSFCLSLASLTVLLGFDLLHPLGLPHLTGGQLSPLHCFYSIFVLVLSLLHCPHPVHILSSTFPTLPLFMSHHTSTLVLILSFSCINSPLSYPQSVPHNASLKSPPSRPFPSLRPPLEPAVTVLNQPQVNPFLSGLAGRNPSR